MFLFKKIIANFFMPMSLLLELLMLGLFILFFTSKQKTGKAILLIVVILLTFFSLTPTADLLIQPLKEKYPPYSRNDSFIINENSPKLVVVLGGGHNPDPSVPAISRIAYETMERLLEGIRIYRMIPGSKLLLSGGKTISASDSSAEVMAEVAKELGVNDEDIIIENESRDTKDQALIINSMITDKRFILVSSSAHMARSMDLFLKLGMDPVPAPTRSIEQKLLNRGPNPFFHHRSTYKK